VFGAAFPDGQAAFDDDTALHLVDSLYDNYKISYGALRVVADRAGINSSSVVPRKSGQTKTVALCMAMLGPVDPDGRIGACDNMRDTAEYFCSLRGMTEKKIRGLLAQAVERYRPATSADMLDTDLVETALLPGNKNWWTCCALLLGTIKFGLPSAASYRRSPKPVAEEEDEPTQLLQAQHDSGPPMSEMLAEAERLQLSGADLDDLESRQEFGSVRYRIGLRALLKSARAELQKEADDATTSEPSRDPALVGPLRAELDILQGRRLCTRAAEAGMDGPAVDAALAVGLDTLRTLIVEHVVPLLEPNVALLPPSNGSIRAAPAAAVPARSGLAAEAAPSSAGAPGAGGGSGPAAASFPAAVRAAPRVPSTQPQAQRTKSKKEQVAELTAARNANKHRTNAYESFKTQLGDTAPTGNKITIYYLGYSHQVMFYCLKAHGIVDDRGAVTRCAALCASLPLP
jgi:hypothetical protein